MIEKFCHTGRHHVKPENIVKRKGRKDTCKTCVELMIKRKKESK